MAAANIGMFFLSFRVLTPKGVPTRRLVPAVLADGLAWMVLQALAPTSWVIFATPALLTVRSPPF